MTTQGGLQGLRIGQMLQLQAQQQQHEDAEVRQPVVCSGRVVFARFACLRSRLSGQLLTPA
jgi:hypothetical protein